MGREHVCPSLPHAVEFVEGPDCEDTYVSFEDTLYLHQRLMELKIALLFTYDTWRRYGVSSEDTSVSLRHKPSTDSAGFSVTRLVPPSPPTLTLAHLGCVRRYPACITEDFLLRSACQRKPNRELLFYSEYVTAVRAAVVLPLSCSLFSPRQWRPTALHRRPARPR